MAQTLKFGKGTWATKKGSTLSYNDESNNYKPLPFTTTRSSSATRVNKEGLIEVVENDRPRIDYTDSEDGVFLLEKAATNLITYSEDLSNFNQTNTSTTDNVAISPSGILNASKTIPNTSNTFHWISESYSVSSSVYTQSIFAKADTYSHLFMILRTDGGANRYAVKIDLNNGTIVNDLTLGSPTNTSYKIENYGNGWYRCSISSNHSSGNVLPLYSASVGGALTSINNEFQGDGTSGVYIFGAQLEAGSYATSYIPTSGSTATRVADTASGAGNSEVFNDSEGMLYANIAALANDGTNRYISISDGSNNNRVQFIYSSDSNKIIAGVVSGNSGQCAFYLENIDTTLNRKLALKYKQNDFSFWSNGFEIGTDTSGIAPTALDTLEFRRGNGTSDFYGKTKEIGYYNTALTDLELEKLTSYVSLSEMATELNYKAL